MKKKILALLLVLIIPFSTVLAEGENEYTTEQINEIAETPTERLTGTDIERLPTDIIDPDVTIDDVGNKILDKLYDVASLLKKIAAPVAIIMFIVGAILMVTGALGKKDGARTGIIVCILSIVMYAICMYSEPIISAVSKWLIS